MAAFERDNWNAGFPFSAAKLGAPTPAGMADPALPLPGDEQASVPKPQPLLLRNPLPTRRIAPRADRLRLLPLQAFVWGSAANPPRPRTRPEHTLIWVTQGRIRLDLPRSGQMLNAGDLRFLPAGTAFAAMPRTDTMGHVLLLPPSLTRATTPLLPDRLLDATVTDAAALHSNIRELAGQSDPDTRACLLNLLALRLSRLTPARPADSGSAIWTANRPLVDRFLELARMHIGQCRTIADMAQELGATSAMLDHACIAARGRRAIDLMNDLRLERAAELLRHTPLTPARIAANLGYTSHAHFTRAFVAATGRTPEVFRNQINGKRG
ncbi:AraC family transcriptional regulator [Paracoccus sp. (in: a-proteobacteria)]|uniref:helix-turn-helix transcriptional regulator n=1 Tax=Paracoccus sp. TaxID=267 RepID=UPI0026DF6BA4|nr:AraC family transcriptional regulator [Paracoccus sp. (in: a-proteobacteria)]MDO5646850.1 AraC family transcriptional regulator [Paracoccus sp. (in: a-proteobacteria)]